MTYETTLTFVTQEPVSPDFLATRIAQAAGQFGALRTGEAIVLPSNPRELLIVTSEPTGSPFERTT